MLITVIVCCFNSEEKLPQCLHRIDSSLREVVEYSRCEVVVVDNSSNDNTKTLALDLFPTLSGAKYILVEESRAGLMHARKAGILAASGKIICFLDDDNWASSDYFKTIIATFENNLMVGFFGCSTRLPNDRNFPPEISQFALSYAVGDLYPRTGLLSPGNVVWGTGIAFRASIIKQIITSEFRPILVGRCAGVQLAGDDTELGHAVAIAGWDGWYQCEPLIEHAIDPRRMNASKLEAMYMGFGASNSINSRYALFSQGCSKLALWFFPFWYTLKLVKNIFCLLFSKQFLNGDLRARISLSLYKEGMRFFFCNPKIWKIQKKNLVVLSEIKYRKKF